MPDDARMHADSTSMQLSLLLPFRVFGVYEAVRRIVAATTAGSFGLLPQRRDCVAALRPGILSYETAAGAQAYVALDQGLLVKTGTRVVVSVRHAIAGADLAELRTAVERDFLELDQRERELRAVLARLEGGIVRRFVALRHE